MELWSRWTVRTPVPGLSPIRRNTRILVSPENTRKERVAGRVSPVLYVAAAVLALPSLGLIQFEGASVPDDLVVVQIPAEVARPSAEREAPFPPLDRYVDGARIVRVHGSGGGAAVLTPEFAGALDPDVSFDGETIVFAGKRDPGDTWEIWRMNADGSGKTRITGGPGQKVAPVFAGARFYLDDPQPTPQIVFSGNENETGSFALYGTDLEGLTLRRLTFNLYSDFSPSVLPTGRVVFSSRQRFEDLQEPEGMVALLAVNIDGTDLMPFYGNHEPPRYKDMAAVSFVGDRVYFVESDSVPWLGGGSLAYVSWRRPLSSYGKLSGETENRGSYHSPRPLPDGGLLASYRAGSDSVFALYRLDPQSGRRVEKVFEEVGWHSIDTQVLAPRPQARGRSNWLRPGSTTGVFYCLDSYRTNLGSGGSGEVAPPGAIKHVRVIEGQPRRILGVAPVEADGSFHIRVPAETPITFQLLDEEYVALRGQQAWTWVMGNENRGCIGCHEDPELSPPNRMVSAVAKPPVELLLPPDRRRTVDFRNQIAPILASSCATAGCHAPGQVEPALGDQATQSSESALRAIYESLLESPTGRVPGPYVMPGSARDSHLIQRLLGRDTGYRGPGGMPHDILPQRELILFVEWADLGAAFGSPRAEEGGVP